MALVRQKLAFLLCALALGAHAAVFARVGVLLQTNGQLLDENALSRVSTAIFLDMQSIVALLLICAGLLAWKIKGERLRAIGMLTAFAVVALDRFIFTSGMQQVFARCDLKSQRPLELYRTGQYYAGAHELAALTVAVLCIMVCSSWIFGGSKFSGQRDAAASN